MNQSTSHNQDAVIAAESVIDIKEDGRSLERGRSPGIDWRWWAGLSAFFVSIALVASILIFGGSLARIARDNSEVSACRAQYTLLITDAQVRSKVVEYELIASISNGDPTEVRKALVDKLSVLSHELQGSLDAKTEFEKNVTLPCPLGELSSSSNEEG